jgi:hypothetical protein
MDSSNTVVPRPWALLRSIACYTATRWCHHLTPRSIRVRERSGGIRLSIAREVRCPCLLYRIIRTWLLSFHLQVTAIRAPRTSNRVPEESISDSVTPSRLRVSESESHRLPLMALRKWPAYVIRRNRRKFPGPQINAVSCAVQLWLVQTSSIPSSSFEAS